MEIIKVTDEKFASFIIESQIKMAKETEDYDLDRLAVTQGVHAVINDPLKGNYYITLENQEPIACLLTVPEWSDWRNKTVLWIHSVYVSESHRQQGIYKAMYTSLQEMVKTNSQYAGLRLYVDKRNTKAIDVYHKLGMESHHYSLCEWLKE
jgi:GNAT superfamily N-acetyltransferase